MKSYSYINLFCYSIKLLIMKKISCETSIFYKVAIYIDTSLLIIENDSYFKIISKF